MNDIKVLTEKLYSSMYVHAKDFDDIQRRERYK